MEKPATSSFSELSALFNNILVIDRKFDIVPDKNHFGLAIRYNDIQECREDFITELVNTIGDWIYCRSKQEELLKELQDAGRSPAGSFSKLMHICRSKFRTTTNSSLLHGQFGELMLFVTIEKLFSAVPILRKMPITTSNKHERYGADAIHYKQTGTRNLILLGEAKTYTSDYRFNTAFNCAIDSILDTYEKHRSEIGTYVFDGFIENDLRDVAKKYIENSLENVEVHLVSIIIYEENTQIRAQNQGEIEKMIEDIICERYSKVDKSLINLVKYPILNRITYIAMPVWDLENLIDTFMHSLN